MGGGGSIPPQHRAEYERLVAKDVGFTALDVARKALELAEADPDFVYEAPDPDVEQCRYVHDGKGSCLFGQALVSFGVDVPESWEGKGVGFVLQQILEPDVDYDLRTHGAQYAPLEVAQVAQDTGRYAWGSDEVAGDIRRWIERNS